MKMRPFTSTIPLEDARVIVERAVRPIARAERVPLAQAVGRVLAEEVLSDVDVPPFARAAMDGYAVCAEDTRAATRGVPTVLTCIDEVFTGHVPQRTVTMGTCSAIATGAPIPPGADAVVMVEETTADGAQIRILAPARPGQHIGPKGGDIRTGDLVLQRGVILSPARVGALGALGRTDVEVFARPTVAVLSTGDEIVDPGAPLGPGQLYDVNRFTLGAIIAEHGGIPVMHRTAGDTLAAITDALDACLTHDLVVMSGGSSVGERDLVLDVIAARGEMLFHGIAIKPGKPTALGRVGDRLIFGMPGYPTSCLSNAYILLAPALRQLARLPAHEPRRVRLPLAARVVSGVGRHQIVSMRVVDGTAVPAFKSSGDITSLSQADGYVEIPAPIASIEAGTIVEVVLF